MSGNFNKNRILKNSLLLYVRMLFTMWINLYATRLVLQNLGVEDMGVYGVVGSIVSLFTVFTSGVTSAVQRFITFELGLKDGQPNKVFCSSLNVIFILSAFMLLLLEVGGLWMLYHKINIPEASRAASFWVFQLSALTCIVNTISIPYNALIIAHEKMNAFAIISIVQVILNFAAAYFISFFTNERLLIYAIMLAAASIIVRLLYQIYCHRKFEEARYHWGIDKNTIKQIGKFTGVSTTSSLLQVSATYGINIVINIHFGVTINAVYEIAIRLKLSFLSFAQNILKSITPQITKTYANKEYNKFTYLIITGSKMQVILLFFIFIPFIFNAEYIIKLWLGELPKYVVSFSIIAVSISLLYSAFEPIRAGVIATNKIRKFMINPELFYLLILPLIFIVCKTYNEPLLIMICILIMEFLACVFRTYYAIPACNISINTILKGILLPCITIFTISFLLCYLLSFILEKSLIGLIEMLIVNSVALSLSTYYIALTNKERSYILQIATKLLHKK